MFTYAHWITLGGSSSELQRGTVGVSVCERESWLRGQSFLFNHVMNIITIVSGTDLRQCTYKVFLKLLHLLLVALQSAVVHGSALDGDLPHLQVHLLQLRTTFNSANFTTISKWTKYTVTFFGKCDYISAATEKKLYFQHSNKSEYICEKKKCSTYKLSQLWKY